MSYQQDFSFVKAGTLNMVLLRNGRECEKIPIESFLMSDQSVRTSSIDGITFREHVVFKFTLEFKPNQPCLEETAVRENTDWVLASCPGTYAQFNKVEERLIFQACRVCILSTVAGLEDQFCCSFRLDGVKGEWVLDMIWR
eukprot:PhM_4_TR3868/c0_g1_i1/m.52614